MLLQREGRRVGRQTGSRRDAGDLRLGAESGEALIALLADDRRTAGIPVIAMTAANEPEVLATLDRAGVVAMLEKPFSATDVAALVEAVLMAGPK